MQVTATSLTSNRDILTISSSAPTQELPPIRSSSPSKLIQPRPQKSGRQGKSRTPGSPRARPKVPGVPNDNGNRPLSASFRKALQRSSPVTPPRTPHQPVKRGKAGKQAEAKQQPQSIPAIGFGGLKITPELYQQQFPGALSLNSQVMCWYPAKQLWFSATVIHARPSPNCSVPTPSSPSAGRPVSSSASTASSCGQSVPGCGKHPATGAAAAGGKHCMTSHNTAATAAAVEVTADAATVKPSLFRPSDALPADTKLYEWPGRVNDYDYYIHFHGEDRRHDMWVSSFCLRPEDFEFDSSDICIKKPPGPDEVHKNMDVDYLREHEENTKLKTIGKIKIGEYSVDTWYFSAYPKEFQNLDVLYICEFCLNFFQYENELQVHSRLCHIRCPPGDEIYRDAERGISVFEVDGAICKQYTENLCFLSKLFLDHKTLKHPVYLFLFYILTEKTEEGYRLVAYFSKEKYSNNNLSCIMCLPQHQRKGYGQFLINLSYALSRREGKKGTPERPLSDLGKASYVKYWGQTAVAALLELQDKELVSIEELAEATSIEPADITMALSELGLLQYRQDTAFLFLPSEHIQAVAQWCRAAFINQIIPPIHNLPQSELGLWGLDVQDVETTKETKSTTAKLSARERRNSKRRRPTLEIDEGESESARKRSRGPEQETLLQTIPETEKTKDCPNSSKPVIVPIPPVNLQDLRWESYDLHLGLYEYAPSTI